MDVHVLKSKQQCIFIYVLSTFFTFSNSSFLSSFQQVKINPNVTTEHPTAPHGVQQIPQRTSRPKHPNESLKLEIEISSFKYFRTVKQKKQIRSFVFWENLWCANLLSVLSDLQWLLRHQRNYQVGFNHAAINTAFFISNH